MQPSPEEIAAAPRRSKAFTATGDFVVLVERVVSIIEDSRARVVRTVNSEMVLSCWHIGRRSMTGIVRREAESPLCLFMGNHQRGFILRPGDAT